MPNPAHGKRLTRHPPTPHPELEKLLAEARPATEADLQAQRRNVAPYQPGEDSSHQLLRA